MRTAMMLLALALVGSPGCKKKEEATPPPAGSGSDMGSGSGSGSAMAGSGSAGSGSAMAGSGSDMGSGSGSAMAGSGAGSGSADTAMQHHAGNCPSTVLGSTTTASIKGKDVVVVVTSKDKDAIAAIQKRADESIKDKDAVKSPSSAHDQKGAHGGSAGICPVYVPEGATAKVKHDKGGVTVTITPKGKPDELKKDVDDRITKAKAWVEANVKPGDQGNQGGVGGGKGKDGSNHSGQGDSKGKDRKKGDGGGAGTGGGGGKGTGGGSGSGKKS